MYNYEHEIEKPHDKAMIKFLWNDYFHDSNVENVSFDNKKNHLIITLISCRDQECLWDKIKGADDWKRQYFKENKDHFTYYLCFEKVSHFTLQSSVKWTNYINGRFKETACLKIIQSWGKEKLYHFRIQLSNGYSDIVFKNFKVRKKIGRINYNIEEELGQINSIVMDSHFFETVESNLSDEENESSFFSKTEDFNKYLEQAKNGKDFDRFIAMSVLYEKKYENLLELVRNNLILDAEWLDCSAYAAYLLGKIGINEDITKLYGYHAFLNRLIAKENNYPYNVFIERTVLDSIELLNLK
jgi:hypothetical protein